MAETDNPEILNKVNEEYWNCVSVRIGSGRYTIVDIEDYELTIKYPWEYHIKKGKGYASCKIRVGYGKRRKSLHRLIMNADNGVMVDHKNRNTLDNRRYNLRFCTFSQNSMNSCSRNGSSSKYKGVHWSCHWHVWRAVIKANKKIYQIGSYDNEDDAALAYNEAAMKYHGEFAVLNVI